MEVDKISFYPLLLDILTDISEAHFIAFDLELSGVPAKKAKSDHRRGKPSLQERYLETKEAAERYQILQIGLTCVEQDVQHSQYILKPYNFELSPQIEERGLDVERDFSFQSGAVNFLMKVGFDMSVPFNNGIPYLSRAESKEARDNFSQRQNKGHIANIDIKPTETESLAFIERVRTEIDRWLESRKFETPDYVNIGKTASVATTAEEIEIANNDEFQSPPEPLSRFEKRLVHQLVGAEYPNLVTISKANFIQIVRFNKEREDVIAANRLKELEQRINRQKGFRWVIEALHGGNISKLNLHECARDPVTGEKICVDLDQLKAQFHRAANLMRGKPRVLVGHNCFLDLVYIYHTFIGALPATVEEFQNKIHRLWPLLIDTKYMSTHNCGDINPVSSLDQIANQLSALDKPVMEVDEEHRKYSAAGDGMLHEAGYDSFLTAQIAVRLSAKLERDGSYVGIAESDMVELQRAAKGLQLTESALRSRTDGCDSVDMTSPPDPDDSFTPSVVGGKWKRQGDPTLSAQDSHDVFSYDPRDLTHGHHNDSSVKSFGGGMPSFASDFWRVYGNKLRVFGTMEGVCVSDGGGEDVVSDGEENGGGGVAVVVDAGTGNTDTMV